MILTLQRHQTWDGGERALSLIGGSVLLYKSLNNITKHPIMAVQGLAASGLLLYRGATGVCPIYQKINYFPPAGSVGRGITALFNGVFEKMISEDIQSFKTYVEQKDFLKYAGLESSEAV